MGNKDWNSFFPPYGITMTQHQLLKRPTLLYWLTIKLFCKSGVRIRHTSVVCPHVLPSTWLALPSIVLYFGYFHLSRPLLNIVMLAKTLLPSTPTPRLPKHLWHSRTLCHACDTPCTLAYVCLHHKTESTSRAWSRQHCSLEPGPNIVPKVDYLSMFVQWAENFWTAKNKKVKLPSVN